MAITKVNICNQALVFLGEKTIISLDDNTRQGELCSTFFDNTRDTLLRSHPWNFALKRMALTRDTVVPYGNEWDYQFILPANYLRVLNTIPQRIPYRIEGNRLLTNESTMGIRYIYRNEDYNSWSPDFAQLVAARLALLLAHTITTKTGLITQAFQWLKMVTQETKGIESQEGSPETINSDNLIDARWLGQSTSQFVKDTLT